MPELDFTKVSRWMYVADGYVIRWATADREWTVKDPGGRVIGVSSGLDGAKAIAAGRHLTDGHGDGMLVVEANDDEESTTMKSCDCLQLTGDAEGDTPVAKPCSEQVPDKRAFKPGHDAKLKSTLLKAFRAGDAIVIVDGSTRTEAVPSILAADRGWSKFMTEAPKRKAKAKAEGDGKDNTGVDHADDQPDDEPVGMSQLARVKVRGAWKDGHVTNIHRGEDGNPQFYTVTYTNAKGKKVDVRLASDSDKLKLG